VDAKRIPGAKMQISKTRKAREVARAVVSQFAERLINFRELFVWRFCRSRPEDDKTPKMELESGLIRNLKIVERLPCARPATLVGNLFALLRLPPRRGGGK
jgi:hypothetical protein